MTIINCYCECCDYTTHRESDMKKHKLTKKHLLSKQAQLEQQNKPKKVQDIEKVLKKTNIKCLKNAQIEFHCKNCHKCFKHIQSLNRHLKKCKDINNEDKKIIINPDQIIVQISEYNELKNDKQKLLDLAAKNADASVINAKSAKKSMSMMNYAMYNFANAPPIKLLEKNEAIKLLTYDKKTKHTLNAHLIYHHNEYTLPRFIGDMIVAGYKKDDAGEQSIWTTDNARLSFIVMELLGSGKKEWEVDKSGLAIKKLIIVPLLEEIKSELLKHIEKLTEIGKKQDNALKYMEDMCSSKEIICEISKGTLADLIIKYISPHFGFDFKLICTKCKQKTHTNVGVMIKDKFYCYSCTDALLK